MIERYSLVDSQLPNLPTFHDNPVTDVEFGKEYIRFVVELIRDDFYLFEKYPKAKKVIVTVHTHDTSVDLFPNQEPQLNYSIVEIGFSKLIKWVKYAKLRSEKWLIKHIAKSKKGPVTFDYLFETVGYGGIDFEFGCNKSIYLMIGQVADVEYEWVE